MIKESATIANGDIYVVEDVRHGYPEVRLTIYDRELERCATTLVYSKAELEALAQALSRMATRLEEK